MLDELDVSQNESEARRPKTNWIDEQRLNVQRATQALYNVLAPLLG